jgi:hypothetical protein
LVGDYRLLASILWRTGSSNGSLKSRAQSPRSHEDCQFEKVKEYRTFDFV